MEDTNLEYFELKYLEEINSLFLKCKEKSDYYGLNLFRSSDFMELFDFIYENLYYIEKSSSEEEQEEEDYLIYNIDAEKIK